MRNEGCGLRNEGCGPDASGESPQLRPEARDFGITSSERQEVITYGIE